MKCLFQKVLKGVYPKIPAVFSSDLSAMIRSLLQVDPEKEAQHQANHSHARVRGEVQRDKGGEGQGLS